MSNFNHQDLEVVVLRKKHDKKSSSTSGLTQTQHSTNATPPKVTKTVVDYRKLDENTDACKHKKVGLSLGKVISSARTAKQWSQKDLASKIQEKPGVINQYEQGKGIPDHRILMRLQNLLGVKLTGKDIGEPLKTNKKK